MPKMPEVNEIVVCKIRKVMNFGVMVELEEYPGIEGFVHISQVATSWIKNIRNFVKEGQVRAAKVMGRGKVEGQVELSLAKVSAEQQRQKIESVKQEKRSAKLLEQFARLAGISIADAQLKIVKPLEAEYGTFFDAMPEIAIHGEEAASSVDSSVRKQFVELVKKSIEIPKKSVGGFFVLHSFDSDGVSVVRNAMLKGESASPKGVQVELFYSGGGKYSVKITSHDFKVSEHALKQVSAAIESAVKPNGSFEFKRV